MGYGHISGTAEITQAASAPNTGLGVSIPSGHGAGGGGVGVKAFCGLFSANSVSAHVYARMPVTKSWLNADLLQH